MNDFDAFFLSIRFVAEVGVLDPHVEREARFAMRLDVGMPDFELVVTKVSHFEMHRAGCIALAFCRGQWPQAESRFKRFLAGGFFEVNRP